MIKPVQYQKKLEGKSNAHLITFDDGKDYVVKYFLPGFEKSLPNEWIAYCLARYIQLPIPFAQIIEIPPEFSSQFPEPIQSTSKYQFASQYVPNCVNGHEVSGISQIVNDDELPSVILFDYWLSNGDRTRKNILLKEEEKGLYRLMVIDHAECFGSYNWTSFEIEELPAKIMKSATHQLMSHFIKEDSAFFVPLELIQTIPIFLIEEIVNLIPDDWQVTEIERKAIVNFLVKRRKKILPGILQKYIAKEYLPIHQEEDLKD